MSLYRYVSSYSLLGLEIVLQLGIYCNPVLKLQFG